MGLSDQGPPPKGPPKRNQDKEDTVATGPPKIVCALAGGQLDPAPRPLAHHHGALSVGTTNFPFCWYAAKGPPRSHTRSLFNPFSSRPFASWDFSFEIRAATGNTYLVQPFFIEQWFPLVPCCPASSREDRLFAPPPSCHSFNTCFQFCSHSRRIRLFTWCQLSQSDPFHSPPAFCNGSDPRAPSQLTAATFSRCRAHLLLPSSGRAFRCPRSTSPLAFIYGQSSTRPSSSLSAPRLTTSSSSPSRRPCRP